MFGIGRLGAPELILILLIALLIFGPRKLPEIGRAIGKAFRELRSQAGQARTNDQGSDVPPTDVPPADAPVTDNVATHTGGQSADSQSDRPQEQTSDDR